MLGLVCFDFTDQFSEPASKIKAYHPNNKQLIGLGIALTVGAFAWVKKCLIINPGISDCTERVG